ncbi:MAG: histidine phosphatase family protein [bacterium]|nr:histidine phosphatase family protein [bacterium]
MNKDSKIGKTIHLIRHGETDFNKQGIIQGSGVNSNLNDKGRWQAERFFDAYNSLPYKHIYTSELNRAIQSVEAFIQKGIPHTAHAGLNEINWGIMEGQPSTAERHKVYQHIIENWTNGNLDIAIENGETPLALFEKQSTALSHIMKNDHEDLILISMHGRAMRSFLCLLTNTPLQQMEKWGHTNLCLYELTYNGSCFDVVKACDIAHL